MRHERLGVELLADAVPAEIRHDRIAVRMGVIAAGRAHVAEEMPRLRRGDAALHALARHAHEALGCGAHLADHVHARSIGVITVVERRHVDIDDVPLLEDGLLRRDAAADHIIDGDADALGIALEIEIRRERAALREKIIHRGVERRRIDARAHHFRHEVERRVVDDAGRADARDICLIIDDLMGRTALPLEEIKLDLVDAFVIFHVAFLILLAAATPA